MKKIIIVGAGLSGATMARLFVPHAQSARERLMPLPPASYEVILAKFSCSAIKLSV